MSPVPFKRGLLRGQKCDERVLAQPSCAASVAVSAEGDKKRTRGSKHYNSLMIIRDDNSLSFLLLFFKLLGFSPDFENFTLILCS
jgi:hypothetical protein